MSDSDLLARFRAEFDSPAFAHIGGEILALDQESGTCRLAFTPGKELCNPLGGVQGGMIAAMLDSACGIAAIAKSGLTVYVPTLEIKTSFLAPVPLARLIARGQCLKLGRSAAFMEASLEDAAGALLARASATAKPVARSAPD